MALRVWLPLDGDLKNLGISNIEITNHGATINNSGKIGKCYQFDNSSSYIELNCNELYKILNGGTQPFSVCFWVNQIDSSRAIILGDYSVSGGNNFNIELNVNHNLRWYWGTPDIVISAMNVGINTWTHVVFTYSGAVLKGYINGIEKYTNTITLNEKNRTSGSYYLGRDGRTGTTTLNGYLNDFRIYDHCLSATEVKEIAMGLVLHYKLDGFFGGSNNNLAQGSKSLAITSSLTNCNISKRGSSTLETRTDGFAQVKGTAAWQGFSLWSNSLNLIVGSTYTYSFYGYTKLNTSTNAGISFYPMMYNSAGTRDTSSTLPISVMGGVFTNANAKQIGTLNATPQLYWTTFTWNQTMADIITNGGKIELSIQIHGTFDTGRIDYLWAPKLELGDKPTTWVPSMEEMGIDPTKIEDSSGYGHNGICVDTTISNDSSRYDACISCMGTTVDNSSNTITGAQFFYCNMEMPAMNAITVTWWGKNLAYGRGGIFETSNTIQTNTTKGTDYNTTAIANWDSTFGIYNGSSRVNIFSNFNKNGNWHHHAITFDGTNAKYYCDSILKQTSALTGTLPAWKSFCMGLGKAGGVWRQIKQHISDLRIYCTSLLDTDIKQLYNVSMKIDNAQHIHTYEIVSNNKNQITKRGQLCNNEITEFAKIAKYDNNLYIEPDGSVWMHIYHHNNPGAGSFASTNDFIHGVYIDENRWFNVDCCDRVDKWELMVKSKYTATQTNENKYRWVQTVNPMLATYAEVAKENIIKNTSTGYTTVDTWGGLYAKKGSAYLTTNNGNSGNWWGAVGSYSVYQSGIPGWGSTVTTTGYNDLYLRIDNVQMVNVYTTTDGFWGANQFIER